MKNTAGKIWKDILKKLRTMFIAGVVVVVPVGLTVWILLWIFNGVEGLLEPLVHLVFGRPVPGVGFGITVVLIFVVGAITTNVVGRRMIRWGESALGRIPVINRLYIAIKEVFQSFSNPEKTGFMHVVLVEWPIKGMKTVGFITNNGRTF